MRILLSLTLLVSLLCAGESDDLKKKLDVLAALDREIAAQKAADKTALGAGRLEELRVAREKLAVAYRRASKKLATDELKPGKDSVTEIDNLIARGQTGDLGALAVLRKLKLRIDAALAPRPKQNGVVFGGGMGRNNVVFVGGGLAQGRIQIMGLGGARVVAVPAAAAKKAVPKKATLKKPESKNAADAAPVVEKSPVTEKELADQEARAKALEKQLIEMTRKVLELERRLTDLRAKVAEADKR